MKLPEYVSIEEVKRVCKELKIRDWTKIKKPEVPDKEAAIILRLVNTEKLNIPLEDFRIGLEVELEHGTMFKEYNVTNNHPVLTGKIVMAHFKEMLDYYRRLDVAEIEGDLLKATAAKDMVKIQKYSKKLANARKALAESDSRQLK